MGKNMYRITVAENNVEMDLYCFFTENEKSSIDAAINNKKTIYHLDTFNMPNGDFAIPEDFGTISAKLIKKYSAVDNFSKTFLEECIEKDVTNGKKIVVYAAEKVVNRLTVKYWEVATIKTAPENVFKDFTENDFYDSIYLIPPRNLFYSYSIFAETITKSSPNKVKLFKPIDCSETCYNMINKENF